MPVLCAGVEIKEGPGELVVPDEIIVRLQAGVPLSAVLQSLNVSAEQLASLTQLPVYLLRVPSGTKAASSKILADSPLVVYVEPHRMRTAAGVVPSDALYSSSWWLTKLQAADAWSLIPGRFPIAGPSGKRVRIAVLDSGVDWTHPDFVNAGGASQDSLSGGQISYQLSRGPLATSIPAPASTWRDDHGHGTQIAGIVAAATANSGGVAALGFPAELVINKVLQANGVGSDMVIADAILAAADAGARVISMSLGGAGYSQLLQDAVDYAWSRDAVVVAAAGNANSAALYFPAGANFAVSVGATGSTDVRAPSSNYGPSLDVMAPGVGVNSTYPGAQYRALSGTSASTALVSALAGLIAQASPGLAADAIAQRLETSSDSTIALGGWDLYYGFGRINAWRALSGKLRIASAGGVSGQVVDASGAPLAGAVLSVGALSQTTNSTGLFRFSNLPAGVHSLTAKPANGDALRMDVVIPQGADSSVRIRTGIATGVLSGYVTASGAPQAGAVVQAISEGVVRATGATDANGYYTFVAPSATYSLLATAFGRSATTVSGVLLESSGAMSQNFDLPAMGVVQGNVRDEAGLPLAGVQVVLFSDEFSAGGVTDSTGSYRIEGLPAGDYNVELSKPEYSAAPGTGVTVSIGNTSTKDLSMVRVGAVTAVVLSPAILAGGAISTTNYATISKPAGPEGLTLGLFSSDSNLAQAPASVTVPPGSTKSANFQIIAKTVPGSSQVRIRALLGGLSKEATLTVTTFQISSVTVTAPAIGSGATTTTNRVTLNSIAPPDGARVTLTSSNPEAAQVPASVVVPCGVAFVNFTITAGRVPTSSAVVITAAYAGSSKTVNLTVNPTALSALILTPTSLGGGNPITTGYVTLDSPAPAGGAVITLSSTIPAVMPPVSITVAEGALRSANFVVPTTAVSTQTVATISASYNGVTKSASVTLRPASLSSLYLSPTTIVAGKTITGAKVLLDGLAAEGGAVVTLTSSSPAVIPPPSVTIPAGANTCATFNITTSTVQVSTAVTLTATWNGVAKSVILTVKPPSLYALTFATTPLTGGKVLTGATVTLDGPAPAGGAVVSVTSSDPDAIPPVTVTVPAGATASPAFSITTRIVPAAKAITITATYGGVSRSQNINLKVTCVISLSVPGLPAAGGKTLGGVTVMLDGPAPPGGATVTLTSSDPLLAPPASVAVAAGAWTSAAFSVSTGFVSKATSIVLTASYNGSSKSTTVPLKPTGLYGLLISAAPIAGGKTLTGATVSLDGPAPPAGVTVSVASSNSLATPPATVFVPAGASVSPAFSIPTGFTASVTPVMLSASYAGSVKTATLTLKPTALSGFSISAAPISGGKPIAGATVSLDGPAPPGGAVVALSSSDPAAMPPVAVNISAGATASAAFAVPTGFVSSAKAVTLSAVYQGSVKTAIVNVKPTAVSILSVSPSTVTGGATPAMATLTLDGPAPDTGYVVPITTSVDSLRPPLTATLPPGASTITFPVPSTAVTSPTTATLSATFNGSVRSVSLLIVPAIVPGQACPHPTNIATFYRAGQVFVTWTDPVTACGTGSCRFRVYRSTTGPISSWASATRVAERIPNNSALRPDFPGAYSGMTAAYRANASSPMSIVPPATTPSATGSGAWAYKPTGEASSYWGVSAVAPDSSCSESAVSPPDNVTNTSVSEVVAGIAPVQQAASTDSGRNPSLYAISGVTGLPLLVDLHASDGQIYDPVAHGPTKLKGDVWNFWGYSSMCWQQGIPQAFVVAEYRVGAHELTYGPFSTFPSTPYSLLLMPQDHQWAKDGTKGTQMDWMGSLSRPLGVVDTTAFNVAPTAYFSNFIENQLDFVVPWVINRYGADPNRIYATGHSMGAWGSITYASYRPSVFAAVFSDRPAFKIPRMPINVMGTAGNTSAYSTVYKMDDTTTLFNTRAQHINRLDCAAPRPPLLWGIGSADGWTVWADHQTFYNAASNCHNFVAVAYNAEGHGSKSASVMYATYANAFRKNVSYPAPTNWSNDDNFDMSGRRDGVRPKGLALASARTAAGVGHPRMARRPTRRLTPIRLGVSS
ncbi:MAG: S8 family serine peptidase [Bryobacterales bacterium]|nr:S8 family serine peptidase [Bryobacterales bacterium]